MATRVPSLNWLRVFEAAARTESFARAARELGMSPAAVSQQVKSLEERLGTVLFRRHAQKVTLTEAGRAYLAPVSGSLLTLESATEGLFGARREDQLFVQSVLIFAHGVLAKGLPEFSDRHPNIALTLATGNSVVDFAQGFHDLMVIFGNPTAYGNASDHLMGEVLYPVARPGVAASVDRPEDLLDHRLIEVATHRAGWPHLFEAARVSPGRARYLFADSTIMAAALASEGQGVALARAPASDKVMREAGLVPCLPGFRVDGAEAYHLIYDDRQALRPPARAFRAWLLEHVASLAKGGD